MIPTYLKSLFSSLAATLAAFGASLCCLGPVVLISLGVSGSMMSTMVAFEPYRPIFIAITIVLLVMAFRKLYLLPNNGAHRIQRAIFWAICLLALALISFPYYGMEFL